MREVGRRRNWRCPWYGSRGRSRPYAQSICRIIVSTARKKIPGDRDADASRALDVVAVTTVVVVACGGGTAVVAAVVVVEPAGSGRC